MKEMREGQEVETKAENESLLTLSNKPDARQECFRHVFFVIQIGQWCEINWHVL